MSVSCVFKCDKITELETCYTYDMNPVQGGFENNALWRNTPSGHFTVTILKSSARVFRVGQKYLFDIQEVNE